MPWQAKHPHRKKTAVQDGTPGIDFGTSKPAMPTTVFDNSEDLSTHFGRNAVAR